MSLRWRQQRKMLSLRGADEPIVLACRARCDVAKAAAALETPHAASQTRALLHTLCGLFCLSLLFGAVLIASFAICDFLWFASIVMFCVVMEAAAVWVCWRSAFMWFMVNDRT